VSSPQPVQGRIRLVYLDPNAIKVPTVRVTSVWDPEEYDEFRTSLEADGIEDPIKCVREGGTFWLADGLHRLQEAKIKGMAKIPVAYKDGTLVDAKVRNLYMNRLRGKTKASEEVRLVKSLMEEDHLTFEEIAARTGLSRERLEARVSIAEASSEILMALDEERITVGIAEQLARLPNAPGQVKLLMALLQQIPLPTADYVRRIVDESLRILQDRAQQPVGPTPTVPVPSFPCKLCGQRWPEGEVIGITIDLACYGLAKDYIVKLMKDRRAGVSREQQLAEQAAGASTSTAGSAPPAPTS
jgi:ParB/RepB/Spo0J family partition protein